MPYVRGGTKGIGRAKERKEEKEKGYVCECVGLYICVHVHKCVYKQFVKYTCIHIYIYIYIFTYMNMFICIHIHKYI